MSQEKEKEKETSSFKNEVIEYFKSLYKRSKDFIIYNKIELSILFVVLFLYFVLTDINTNNTYCNKGGAPPNQQQQQQLQQQQQQLQQQQQKRQQELYQVKSQLSQMAFTKMGSIISNSNVLSKVICYITSLLRSGMSLFSIVFAVMLIPGVPVFGFMLILFTILRSKVADIKAL